MEKKLTPDSIQNTLFYFHDAAHKYHLDTKSFAEHKALNKLYEGVQDFKDSILEMLMGYLDGKRLGDLKGKDVPPYSHDNVIKLVDEIREFALDLYEWAESKKYCGVENAAQDLSGLAAKTRYMLTLS